jgi:NADPH:quinone reductase
MRAVWWTEVGPPSVLVPGEAPDPAPGEGQVLIRVAVASITYIETQIRGGRSPRVAVPPPSILGNGVGGTVLSVGPSGDPALAGRRVVTVTGGSGGYASLAVAPASELIQVPDGVEIGVATALLADGRTALGLHQLAAPRAGETVLVEAAGGGVGSLLVQLAAAAGARVIAAASAPRKLELARSLGAHEALDYTDPGWGVRLKELAPDLVYDGVGGSVGQTALDAVAPGGRFVIHGVASGAMTDTSGATGVEVLGFAALGEIAKRARDLSVEALDLASAGRLRPTIGQTFPLERAADAHAAIEARQTLGKTLLIVE